ncbi:MAG: WecB/TagA/CpsF family glycosyltransferase [Lachnospirales bacterium]
MKTKILNINFDLVKRQEALERLLHFLKGDSPKLLFTPNPEMVMRSRDDREFEKILNSGDLVVPDGIGIVYASKLNKNKIEERVAGCDLIMELLKSPVKKTVYLLGSKEENVKLAASNIEKKLNARVVGYRNGFFQQEEEEAIVNAIGQLNADIILIGLGMVKQETFAYKYKEQLNCKIIACVGGTIDVLSENVKRAPKVFIRLNLEWFYRLLCDPRRILRMIQLPIFAAVVVKEKLGRKDA